MSEVKVNKISPRTNCGTVTVGDSGDSVSVAAGVPVTVNNNLTVSGDLKSAALKAADGGNIINQCGATITLGANDDTVVLGTGAAFGGGVGAVKWETTPQTGSFGAVAGRGYFMNTTSGALTLTLPASPNAGDIVAVKDYANTFDTNNLTIAGNGSNIGGSANDVILSTEGTSITLVYVDATKGWLVVQEGAQSDAPQPAFIQATGGTETTCGDYKIHTFTGPGTFCVSSLANGPTNPQGGPNNVDYLVVAGGGSGGSNSAGGGGAGGYRESKNSATSGCWSASPLATPTSLPISATAYPITVGGGASPVTNCNQGLDGSNSVFSTITSAGGGGGGAGYCGTGAGRDGGSGGGGGASGGSEPQNLGGSGNTPPVSPPQGSDGGDVLPPNNVAGGGGGGGATGSGANAIWPGTPGNGQAGNGGSGATNSINGTPTARGGGGGGGAEALYGSFGTGGTGGGGDGGGTAVAGTANTGGGGGGSGFPNKTSGGGGSGIVIIRYKYQ